MTRDEEHQLLYLECRCVDNDGWINVEQMNEADFAICKKWNKEGYILFGRMHRAFSTRTKTHLVRLSDEAWNEVARLRKERALRNYPKDLDRSMLCGEQGEGPL